MNKRHYEHTLPNIRGSLSNTYKEGGLILSGVSVRPWQEGEDYNGTIKPNK